MKARAYLRRLLDKFILFPYVHRKMQRYKIMNSMDSIIYIINNKCSLSRFGDGEFKVIAGYGNEFQEPDKALGRRLLEILQSEQPNHKVAIPELLVNTSSIANPWGFWHPYTVRFYKHLKHWLKPGYMYLDAMLSRFYFSVPDKSHCAEQLAALKQIWEGRDIVIVEGEQTRSGFGNDLYDNAKSIRRILGLPKNAFDEYDEMLSAIVTHVEKDKLILLSYGMTATVLAYDLAKLGYWAIDIGHLDIEYEWFKMGATEKVPVKGKFTNEAKAMGGHDVSTCDDRTYLAQIICNICETSKYEEGV